MRAADPLGTNILLSGHAALITDFYQHDRNVPFDCSTELQHNRREDGKITRVNSGFWGRALYIRGQPCFRLLGKRGTNWVKLAVKKRNSRLVFRTGREIASTVFPPAIIS